MNTIDSTTAINEIHSAYETVSFRSPFFFVIGAGVSSPSVPLSREIIEHCRQKASARESNFGNVPRRNSDKRTQRSDLGFPINFGINFLKTL